MSDEYKYTAIEWFRDKAYRKPKKIVDIKSVADLVDKQKAFNDYQNKSFKEDLIRSERPRLSASVMSNHIGEAGYRGESMYQLGLFHPLVVRVKKVHQARKRKQVADELAPKILSKFIEDMED
jgi:hypothetical protein